jgi:hypothetical protein
MADQPTNCITFNSPPTEEVLRLDKEGFHYRGQFIADAGEVHRLMVEFLKQNTKSDPQNAPMTDFRALCAELLAALENEGYAHWSTAPDEDELCLRARAALSQPEPEQEVDEYGYPLQLGDFYAS